MLIILFIFIKICFARAILFERFDIIDALLIELPLLLFIYLVIAWLLKKRKQAVFLGMNVVLSVILFALVVYYRYYGSLATYTSLLNVNQVTDVMDSVWMLIKPSYWLFFIDIPFIVIMMVVRKPYAQFNNTMSYLSPLNKVIFRVIGMVVTLGLVISHIVTSIDGTIINDHRKAERMGLFTYQAYVVYADSKRDYTPQFPLNLRTIQSVKGIIEPSQPQFYGIARDQDIYVVQLEAFQNFVIGLRVGGREVTPNLNALLEESFYFSHVFQQIGRGNTSDAEFIMNASVHSSGSQPLSMQFGDREVPGLPRYLRPLGYESVTLHTNDVSFWDRKSMYTGLGFDRFYDKSYFGEEDFLLFGATDEVLYEKSLPIFAEIKSRQQLIYAHLIAMSSHSPFLIPESKDPFPLPSYLEDHIVGRYIQATHYADKALGQFIQRLKDNHLWDHATLVIYGDHFGFSVQNEDEELELAADLLGLNKYTQVEMFNVPLVIRVAGHDEAIVTSTVGGQIDILPTLANLLGLNMEGHIYFGQDLLNHTSNLIPLRVYSPTGSFINDDVMFIPGEGFEDGWVIPLVNRSDRPDITPFRSDFERALQLIELSDQYLHNLPFINQGDRTE